MNFLTWIEILSALAGLALSAVLFFFPRFGPTSWMLALTVVSGSLSAGALGLGSALHWTLRESAYLSFAGLIFCGSIGCMTSYVLQRDAYQVYVRKNRWFYLTISSVTLVLVTGLYVMPPPQVLDQSPNLIALGFVGFVASLYLILISVLGLANVEQRLRSIEEHVRWEIKFLLLGLASMLAATIYVASQVLLFAPQLSLLSLQSLTLFPIIFLCSCLLIFKSWTRSSGRGRVFVSQGAVYNTITLFSVGIYLVASSLAARWVSELVHPSVPIEPMLFLFSAIVLSSVLLGTAFRHRVRRWIRRNIFAGNYDYRQLWMDAAERVRAIDSPAVTAAAFAQLVHDALGSLDISIWLREGGGHTMRVTAARGTISELLPQDGIELVPAILDVTEPTAVGEISEESLKKWPDGFLKLTKAALVVPLISSDRLVGLVTVGSDRSGRPFNKEERECLRVLAVHAASEFHKSELMVTLVQTREAAAFQAFSTFLLHDLKNFASTLSLIAKNAVRHHGNPDFHLDAFRSVLETAEKMKRLCNGLRTFSTNLAANKKQDDLHDIIRQVVNGFDRSLSNRVVLDLGARPLIEIDRQEFSRVLQNLILNANEASPEGRLIELSTRSEPNRVVICVIDKGKGIPKDFLEKELFHPFRTTKGDGLGIGLFQSKKIVESHDGTIEVESQEGEGTTVRIVLPCVGPSETLIYESALDKALAHEADETVPHRYTNELTT